MRRLWPLATMCLAPTVSGLIGSSAGRQRVVSGSISQPMPARMAASMALLGGVAAMIITSDPSPLQVAERDPVGNPASDSSATMVNPEALQTIELAPKTAKRTILDSTDRTVIIPNGSKPMRLMRVDLVDRVVFLSPDGEEVHLEVPSVNYQLIPVLTD